jgi:ubiquitin C-terminal hydrolase
MFTKVSTPVEDPFQLTIKEKHIENGKQDLDYQLAGFIVHSGGFGGGHYTAYAKKGGKWYLYNDANVYTPLEQEIAKAAETAYIYFYKPTR